MRIDNSRIFTADVYEITDFKKNTQFETTDVSFGGFDYDSKQTNKQMVFIKFKHMYVPVAYIQNAFQYLDIASHVTKTGIAYPDYRFLYTSPSFGDRVGSKFVKNVKPLFSYPGKISLKELVGIQKLQNDRDDTYSGGMEMM